MSLLLALFKHRFDLAAFLGTYGGVFKVCYPPLFGSTLLFNIFNLIPQDICLTNLIYFEAR